MFWSLVIHCSSLISIHTWRAWQFWMLSFLCIKALILQAVLAYKIQALNSKYMFSWLYQNAKPFTSILSSMRCKRVQFSLVKTSLCQQFLSFNVYKKQWYCARLFLFYSWSTFCHYILTFSTSLVKQHTFALKPFGKLSLS
jgi:hypothetical protein